MKQRRFRPTRGAYHGTHDDRIDRWYIDDSESTVVDRRGPGYRTKAEAQAACDLLERLGKVSA